MYQFPSKSFFLTILSAVSLNAFGASGDRLVFEGLSLPAIGIEVPANTGLDMVYVCYDTSNSAVKFPSQNPNVKWYRYSNLGGSYAEEVMTGISYSDGFSVLENPQGDMGYIVEDGDRRAYFWIVRYSGKKLTLKSIKAAPEQDCDYSVLEIEGEGEPLHYFTINGQQKVLSREIEVTYNTLTFNEDNLQFIQGETTDTFEALESLMRVSPPAYCQTVFTISGDRFLKEWNWLETLSSEPIAPHAVMVYTTAEQSGTEDLYNKKEARRKHGSTLKKGTSRAENDESSIQDTDPGSEDDSVDMPSDSSEPGSNVIGTDTDGLGGSAPADISFRAYVTDGVLHSEWQMSENPDFEPIDYHFYQQDLDYTFTEEGTFYLRFIGSNADGSCEAVGETYTVTIGASELKIPNAFTPNGDGVNDEWKVAYRSLTKFDCWIFDRYGNEVCHLASPDQGWDGKVKGKEAKPGVFYYVIEAEGADGKKYKKSGDINILRYVGGTKNVTPDI